jgi:hypothetical protein
MQIESGFMEWRPGIANSETIVETIGAGMAPNH